MEQQLHLKLMEIISILIVTVFTHIVFFIFDLHRPSPHLKGKKQKCYSVFF